MGGVVGVLENVGKEGEGYHLEKMFLFCLCVGGVVKRGGEGKKKSGEGGVGGKKGDEERRRKELKS